MAKRIYPGNYVNALSGHLGQSVVAQPGRLYYHKVGYAKVDATGGIVFDVIIPSPDKRTGTDKQQADITGMVVPVGASLYHLGIRVVDARKDKGVGTAFSGLVGTNTNEIKLASAVNVAGGALTATTASTPADVIVAAPGASPSPRLRRLTAPASSITSMALSGKKRSLTYLADNSTADLSAVSV